MRHRTPSGWWDRKKKVWNATPRLSGSRELGEAFVLERTQSSVSKNLRKKWCWSSLVVGPVTLESMVDTLFDSGTFY